MILVGSYFNKKTNEMPRIILDEDSEENENEKKSVTETGSTKLVSLIDKNMEVN